MAIRMRLALTALVALGLGGCMARSTPAPDAYSRDIGPGSSASGRPQSDLGSRNSGVTHVPGAPAAGGNGISGN